MRSRRLEYFVSGGVQGKIGLTYPYMRDTADPGGSLSACPDGGRTIPLRGRPAPTDDGNGYGRTDSTAAVSSADSGSTFGSKRFTTRPCGSTRNLVKFHFTSPLIPSDVSCVSVR